MDQLPSHLNDTIIVDANFPSPQPAAEVPPHYRLIENVKVPGATIDATGLVLVVGPNSSGKTQLLKDVHSVLTGQKRDFVVAKQIPIRKPDTLDAILAPMIDEGHLKIEKNNEGQEYIKQTNPALGGFGFQNQSIHRNDATSFWTRWAPPTVANSLEDIRFLNFIGHGLVTALFLDKRITLANHVGIFDFETQLPNSDVQALYMDTGAKVRLNQEIQNVFGKAVWVDTTRGSVLCIRVNQKPFIPLAEDRLEPQKMREYREIESEGDGMRSYVGICIALLLGRRPVCLIDEPELCLHPPQANAMGRFIGSYGNSPNHLTLASTHSSHVLRGVIETTEHVQILRLCRVDGEFKGHLIGRDALLDCLKRPIVRAETVLDGIFADGVTIVESDGDRAVYQSAWEAAKAQPPQGENSEYRHRDILFVPVGGTGGIADITRFYRALRIPVGVIADLDLIMDKVKLRGILTNLTTSEVAEQILSDCSNAADRIKALPPTISEVEVKARLSSLVAGEFNWINNDDKVIKSQLNRLANDIDRMRRLKSGGIQCFKDDPAIHQLLTSIIAKCQAVGLFLVPVGELEHWSPELDVEASKYKKAEWANEAAARLRHSPEKASDLVAFMQAIGTYHVEEAKKLA